MALELVGGAVVGAIVGELLKAVLDAKQKASAFQPALARLESTLKAMIPRLDQISRLNYQLNLQHPEMEELVSLIINGRALVVKCSKISTINLVKKVQYSKELLDLENSLLRYFMTILPLDHLKDTKEILVVVKDLQMKLVGDHKDGGIHQSESAGTHKENSASAAPEAVELLQDYSNDELRRKELLVHAKDKVDGTICNKDASDNVASKADVKLPNADSNGGLDMNSRSNSTPTVNSNNQAEGTEFIVEFERGVYITLVAQSDGTRDIVRVRFSQRLFVEVQAETWWLENCEKVYEMYNVRNSRSLKS